MSRSPSHSIRSLLVTVAVVAAAGCGNSNNAGGESAPDAVMAIAKPDLSANPPADGSVMMGDMSGDMTAAMEGDGSMAPPDMVIIGNPCTPPTSITVLPAMTNANVSIGTPYMLPYTATAHYAGMPDQDITKTAFFYSSDPTLGVMVANVFTWAGLHGGGATISARLCGSVGNATITLALSTNEGKGGVNGDMSKGKFMNAPPTQMMSCNPTLVYPPDGVLLPPNTNVIEVHFTLGSPPNNLFQISFSNGITNINLYTTCTGMTPADGMPLNGGCTVELSQSDWDWLAQTNRNGDPIKVTVSGVGCDGNNVGKSATRQISFAKDDMQGILYYWASLKISVQGAPLNSGGVFRYDYGKRGQLPDPVLTPSTSANPNHLCIGCHGISRDGRQMIFLFDDNDDDDEYGDVRTDVYDIAAQLPAQPIIKNGALVFPPGYHTWNRATTEFLLSDGFGNSNGAFGRVSVLGKVLGTVQAGALRGTTPDYAPDDSVVVFAVPPNVSSAPPNPGYWMKTDDLWFAGASLYTAPWDGMNKKLGNPTMLLPAQNGANLYYPSFSPEGTFIAFNQATSGPNFHNPLARVEVVVANQGNPKPVDLAALNDKGSLTNSWARWAPFVQNYKGGKILWITFSSTRDYGLRIQNGGKVNCYPSASPIGPFFNVAMNCDRAQIWMAAIKLDANGVMQGNDPSWPAFWLPFQDLATNNHLAQWAQRNYSGICMADGDCKANLKCCVQGACTACPPPPPPPPPACTMDVNCPPGQCCTAGACVQCAGDGGMPPDMAMPNNPGCNTCLDCKGQACINGMCDKCTNSAQCCAPLVCANGQCVMAPP